MRKIIILSLTILILSCGDNKESQKDTSLVMEKKSIKEQNKKILSVKEKNRIFDKYTILVKSSFNSYNHTFDMKLHESTFTNLGFYKGKNLGDFYGKESDFDIRIYISSPGYASNDYSIQHITITISSEKMRTESVFFELY